MGKMKIIGVYTKDFNLAHDLISRINERGLEYIQINSLNNIPNKVGVIITSSVEGRGLSGKKVVYADCFEDIDFALDRAIQILHGDADKIIIGIDPGEYPGIAVLYGENILRSCCASSTDDAIRIVRSILREFSDKESIIRIGHDARIYRDRIINSLRDVKSKIEIVNEARTSQKSGYSRIERNQIAAIKIARSKGESIGMEECAGFTEGEIREIQRKSRMLSDGKITISRRLAIKVLKGEIKMEEAIDLHRSSN